MSTAWQRTTWLVAWALIAVSGAGWLGHARLQQLRGSFETDARIVHRLLSQQVVQNDAVMATLALLQPRLAGDPGAALAPGPQRLPAVYPHILDALQRPPGRAWPNGQRDALEAAETASRRSARPALAGADFAAGRYWLVQAGDPASYALQLDLRATVPWTDWPMDARTSPVRVALVHAGQSFTVQAGRATSPGWHHGFQKTLASPSQPFEVSAQRDVGWRELPWLAMLAWAAGSAAALAGAAALARQRVARRRAEELLRLGQVARLNTLGELAAGMAHELNQPLTALLANTQAAQRLLDDDRPSWRPPAAPWRRPWRRRGAPRPWWGGCAGWSSGPIWRARCSPCSCRARCTMRCTCWSPNCAAMHWPRRSLLKPTCPPCRPIPWRCSRSFTTCS